MRSERGEREKKRGEKGGGQARAEEKMKKEGEDASLQGI